MGSTWSGPVAYLQKQGWPRMGIPASFEILCSCWVKFLQRKITDIEILLDYQFFTSCCRLVLYIYDKIFKYSWHLMNNSIFIFSFKFEKMSYFPLQNGKRIKQYSSIWHDVALPENQTLISCPIKTCCVACFTWERPPWPSSGGRNKRWPTPWSPSPSRTACPSCPTHLGLALPGLWSKCQMVAFLFSVKTTFEEKYVELFKN